MTATSYLLSILQSIPVADRCAQFRNFKNNGGDLHQAVWDEPEALLGIASALGEAELDEHIALELTTLTRNRAREVLRGSHETLDYQFAVAFARASFAAEQTSDGYEALSAVYYSKHKDLAADLFDRGYAAWAVHAARQAQWVEVDGHPRLDSPSANGGRHLHSILTVTAMTLNGVTEHTVLIQGAKEISGLREADLQAIAVRAGNPGSLVGATITSPHADAETAFQAVILDGRRQQLEHATGRFADALVAAFDTSDMGAISQGLLKGNATAVSWLKQVVLSRQNDGALSFNQSWLDVVRARLPDGYTIEADYGQQTPLGPEALVLRATHGERSVSMLLDDKGQFGATPIQ